MTDKRKKEMQLLIDRITSLETVKASDIPRINLYMDQLTTFMDDNLASSKRYPQDKILTKTMINNYAKNRLLPPPEKKKYSRDHVILLLFIYYMKNIISISDINTLLDPVKEEYFGKKGTITLSDLYTEILSFIHAEEASSLDLVKAQYEHSDSLFSDSDISEEEKDKLRRLAFICALSFDVYLKKMMIETLIDEEIAKEKKEKERTEGKKTKK